ncbi:MAG: Hint domain-containing protein [Paracoccaceae bacterium]
MMLSRHISPPELTQASHSFRVLDGTDVIVTDGANLGDGVNHAAEVELADIYRVRSDAVMRRMTLHAYGDNFVLAPDTEVGMPGAMVCLDCALHFMSADGASTDALVLVELDTQGHIAATYLLPLADLAAQVDYALIGINQETARQKLAQLACVSFSRGTRITLANGTQIPIEDLRIGDKVLSRDEGPQEIRWIGQSTLRATGEHAPIRIAANALNNHGDLVLSPDHRLFIYQRQDKIGVGRAELLVKARHLVNGDSVTVMAGGFVDYFQLLFDTHQIIYAEGIAAESFLMDARTQAAVPSDVMSNVGIGVQTCGLTGFDVQEDLLNYPDAAKLLRSASVA